MRTGFSGSEETLLGRGAEFNGTLTFKDSMRIEGNSPEISSDGTLILEKAVKFKRNQSGHRDYSEAGWKRPGKIAVELHATGFLR